MKSETTDVKNLRKSVKGALRNLQGITTHQHLKKIDGGFRSELAETTETMLNFLQDSSDPAKVEAMELQMLNVIDNIENGTTEKVLSKSRNLFISNCFRRVRPRLDAQKWSNQGKQFQMHQWKCLQTILELKLHRQIMNFKPQMLFIKVKTRPR